MSTTPWMPSPPVSEGDRAWMLAAIESIRHSINSAELWDRDLKEEDAQKWAMRISGSLQDVGGDLAWLRSHLARIASDAGLSTRQISAGTGISHSVVGRMAKTERERGFPPPSEVLNHLNLNDDEDAGSEALLKQLVEAGISESTAEEVRQQLQRRKI